MGIWCSCGARCAKPVLQRLKPLAFFRVDVVAEATTYKAQSNSTATEPARRRRYEIDFNGAEILGCLRPGLLSGLRSLALQDHRGALGGFADLSGALPALLGWMA